MNKIKLIFCVVSALLFFNGCATQLTNNAERFAQAGIEFSDSIPLVIDESFKKSIEINSQALLETRSFLVSKTIKEKFFLLKKQNNALMKRAELFKDIKKHAKVLKAYFIAIESLASSDAPTNVKENTTSLLLEISKINEDMKNKLTNKAFDGAATLKEIIPKAEAYIVSGIKTKALELELKKNGRAIEQELALFEGIMKLLEQTAIKENNTIQTQLMKNNINMPFIDNNKSISENWISSRTQIFLNATEISPFTIAKKAAQLLKLNFIAIIKGQSTKGNIKTLTITVNELAKAFIPKEIQEDEVVVEEEEEEEENDE